MPSHPIHSGMAAGGATCAHAPAEFGIGDLAFGIRESCFAEFAGDTTGTVPSPANSAKQDSRIPNAKSPIPNSAGAWAHVAPPAAIPEWIGCDGISELFAYTHDHRPAGSTPRS